MSVLGARRPGVKVIRRSHGGGLTRSFASAEVLGAASIRDEVQLSAATEGQRTTERPKGGSVWPPVGGREPIIGSESTIAGCLKAKPFGQPPALTQPPVPALKRHRVPNDTGARHEVQFELVLRPGLDCSPRTTAVSSVRARSRH